MNTVKEIIIPTVVLFLICLCATTLLGLTNQVTAPKIEELIVQTQAKSRAEVLPQANSFGENLTHSLEGEEYEYCEGYDVSGALVGYTFTTSSKGYGGDVKIMTGVDLTGKVTGVSTLSLNETPGLGMNAKKDAFRSQYIGKSGVIGVSTASKSAENGIDALTGATITSRAVTNSVNIALELYADMKGGAE